VVGRADTGRKNEASHIDLPFPTQQVLFHDQTDTTAGDRARQREGWPGGSGPVPGPALDKRGCAPH